MADATSAVRDPRDRRAVCDRQPVGERRKQPAVSFADASVDAAVLVTVAVAAGNAVEFDRMGPGADRVEQCVPPAAPAPITAISNSDSNPGMQPPLLNSPTR